MDKRFKAFWARAALFSATMIWGSSFFLTKNTIVEVETYYLIAARFCVAALLVGALFAKRLKNLSPGDIGAGALLGALLFFAYAFQTFGLAHTTPGENAFLTAVYCIIVPFIYCVYQKKPPKTAHVAGALLCMAGIGLVSLNSQLSLGKGEGLTLVCGVFLALHIVFVSLFSKKKDIIALTILQFAFAGVISLAAALAFNSFPKSISPGAAASLAYLSICSTAGALLLQNIGQKYTHAATASVILSLESVFGVLFSVVFYGESPSAKTIWGFISIFAAIIISESGGAGFTFFRPKTRPSL